MDFMKESHQRTFAHQAEAALLANPGQDQASLAQSMGIENGCRFKKNLGLAAYQQKVHGREGNYYAGPHNRT